jgi:hypothetical protein
VVVLYIYGAFWKRVLGRADIKIARAACFLPRIFPSEYLVFNQREVIMALLVVCLLAVLLTLVDLARMPPGAHGAVDAAVVSSLGALIAGILALANRNGNGGGK